MKKKRYVLLTLILSLLGIPKIYASCTEEMKEEFERIEKSYKITTSYNSNDKTYSMTIEEGDRSKFRYVFDIDYKYECKEVSNTKMECTGLKNGTSFSATVLGMTEACNELLREDFIRLEKYNEYHNDPLCEGAEDFALCQEIYDKDVDRETFESRVELYKEEKQKETEEQQKKEEEQNNIVNKTTTYVKENLVQIIIVVVFIILIIISTIVTIINVKKSRRLE